MAISFKMMDFRAPKNLKEVRLAILADWHYGSPQCRYSSIKRYVKRIQQDDACYWIAVGDLMEMALISSLGDVYHQRISPRAQINEVADLLRPIASRCLGICNGNHSARVAKTTSIHPDEELAQKIGRPDCYFGASIQGRIVINDTTHWLILAHHTTGGGATMGSKLEKIVKLTTIMPTMDIYIGAHSHADVAGSNEVFVCEPAGRGFIMRRRVRRFTGSGAEIEYNASYAHDRAMPPAATCQVILTLGSRVHRRKDNTAVDRFEKPYGREVVYL